MKFEGFFGKSNIPVYSDPLIESGTFYLLDKENYRYKVLNRKKYRGYGRPRKSDYDMKSLRHIQKEFNKEFTDKIDKQLW